MTVHGPFQGVGGESKNLSITNTSKSVQIISGTKSVRIVNSFTGIAYVKIGRGVLEATTADIPILGNQEIVLGKFQDDDVVAAISTITGTTLNITPGEGGL